MAQIENEELLINETDRKKILSALKRIEKATKEVSKMGYQFYLSAHGSLNVMNVEGSGGYKSNLDFTYDMVVANGTMHSTDAGDW